MPVFRRSAVRPDQPQPGRSGEPAALSVPGRPGQPGPAVALFVPPPAAPAQSPSPGQPPQAGQGGQPVPGEQRVQAQQDQPQGPYSTCYAISTGPDPTAQYYRYAWLSSLYT